MQNHLIGLSSSTGLDADGLIKLAWILLGVFPKSRSRAYAHRNSNGVIVADDDDDVIRW